MENSSVFSVESDKFTPLIECESSDFLLPEDQIDIVSGNRRSKLNIKSFQLKPTGPLYLNTCYDEFSRNFVSVNIARNSPDFIPLVQGAESGSTYESQNRTSSNIMQNYHPGYS